VAAGSRPTTAKGESTMHSRGRFAGPKFGLLFFLAAMLLTAMTSVAQSALSGLLVTGKYISSPQLGTQLNVGSLPMNIVLSRDGKYEQSGGSPPLSSNFITVFIFPPSSVRFMGIEWSASAHPIS